MVNIVERPITFFVLLTLVSARLFAADAAPDYHARRVRLAEKLKGGVMVLFAAQPPKSEFYSFRQDSDFYYLTGWKEPSAALLIQSEKPAADDAPALPYREILFLPARNKRAELFTGVKMDGATPGAAAIAHVDEVRPMADLSTVLNELRPRKLLGQPDSVISRSLLTWVAATLGVEDSNPNIADVSPLIGELRAIKDPLEVELLTKAAKASAIAQVALRKAVDAGATEGAVAGAFTESILKQGCARPSYPPIVGSGANATVLHYDENSGTMQAGDVVVIDAAAECNMYASDITRTLAVSGKFSARQQEIYRIVRGAQQAAINSFVAGKSRVNDPKHKYPDSLDSIAFAYMNEHGKDLHGEPLGKYCIHGIGHSVGLDVHDPYDYSKPLEKGMVFTIEPGIYLPEEKIGVRIEDTFYVTPEGKLVSLTGSDTSLP
jgi:Xaa-Pro aminopeptidase